MNVSGVTYYDFRDHLAADIRHGLVNGGSAEQVMARATACAGIDAAEAGELVERFYFDLQRGLERRRRV